MADDDRKCTKCGVTQGETGARDRYNKWRTVEEIQEMDIDQVKLLFGEVVWPTVTEYVIINDDGMCRHCDPAFYRKAATRWGFDQLGLFDD